MEFLSFKGYLSYQYQFHPITKAQTILLTAGGVIAYSLFRKKAALGTLNFYPASVKNIEFDGATPIMTIGIAVQNTSNQTFSVRSLAGNVYANNYLVGNIANFTAVSIAQNSQTIMYVKVRMSLLGIVNDIIRAFSTGYISQEIKLESYANVDNLQIPVNLTYKVG